MAASDYVTPTSDLVPGTKAKAEDINEKVNAINAGFDKLPIPRADSQKGFDEPIKVPAPVDPDDVATKNWTETSMTSQVNQAATSAANAATSASNAATSESNAATSATNASNSAVSAAGSAASAATSEGNAATSEANAATSETNAATSESNAATSATNAATSATNAANSATASANSATASANSASAASTSETNAANSASAAATSASNAATSESNAAASATTAAAAAVESLSAQGLISEAEYRARQATNREKFAGSGFVEWGWNASASDVVNSGLRASPNIKNTIYVGGRISKNGSFSRTAYPLANINGSCVRVDGARLNNTGQGVGYGISQITLPAAPTASVESTTTTTQDYSQGDFVVTGNDIYICVADSTTGTLLTNTSFFESRPAVSRQDLVFLESWEEKITDKDIVYPYGNVQFGATSWEGIGLSNALIAASYSAFGAWETSPVAGYGLRWSTASGAQKQAFIDDPENNIFVNAVGELVQARYRIRTVPGLGDEWYNVQALLESSSNNTEYYLAYSNVAPQTRVLAQGSQIAPVDYGVSSTEFKSANSNFLNLANKHKSEFIGHWASSASSSIAYDERCFSVPIALVQRRNQGAYHPVYNPEGSRLLNKSDQTDKTSWHNPQAQTLSSTADAFSIGAVNSGSPVNDFSGYIGESSGRPDFKYYDAIHASDVKDLRKSARRVEDFARTNERELQNLIAGKQRGFEGVRGVLEVVTATPVDAILVEGRIRVRFATPFFSESQQDPAGNKFTSDNMGVAVLIDASGTPFKVNAVIAGGSPDFAILHHQHGENPSVVNVSGSCAVVAYKKRTHQQETLLHCDIIGDPSNYPAEWNTDGVAGFPLVVGEDGGSLLPADVVANSSGTGAGNVKRFKLSRKSSGSATNYSGHNPYYVTQVIRYSGGAFSAMTPHAASPGSDMPVDNYTASAALNELWLDSAASSTDVFMVFYETPANPLEVASSGSALNLGGKRVFSSDSLSFGATLTQFFTGRIPTGSGNYGFSLGNEGGETFNNNGTISVLGLIRHNTAPIVNENSPAVKIQSYLTKSNGVFYLQALFKELTFDGVDYGDTGDFTVLDNLSTATDDNANTVLVGQKRLELPFFYVEDEQ